MYSLLCTEYSVLRTPSANYLFQDPETERGPFFDRVLFEMTDMNRLSERPPERSQDLLSAKWKLLFLGYPGSRHQLLTLFPDEKSRRRRHGGEVFDKYFRCCYGDPEIMPPLGKAAHQRGGPGIWHGAQIRSSWGAIT